MIFSQTAEYALRAMAVVAQLPPGVSISSRRLAIQAGVPQDYVSKILRRMVQGGLLLSQRGHGGGFRLARSPGSIRFLDILLAANEPLEWRRCVFGRGVCCSDVPCPLHGSFSHLRASLHRWASTTTLADVGSPPNSKRPTSLVSSSP